MLVCHLCSEFPPIKDNSATDEVFISSYRLR